MVSTRQIAVAAAMMGGFSLAASQNTTNIYTDTFFYGQSPPVYPARKWFCHVYKNSC
jgi:hypothetical protein